MKYRCLSYEELTALQKEFFHFLASNHVTGEDWVDLQKNAPERAFSLIELFSDLVFDKILTNTQYLEQRQEKSLRIFKCNTDTIELVALEIAAQSPLSLDQPTALAEAMGNLQNTQGISVYHSSKKYDNTREQDLFKMMTYEQCYKTDNKLFDLLLQATASE